MCLCAGPERMTWLSTPWGLLARSVVSFHATRTWKVVTLSRASYGERRLRNCCRHFVGEGALVAARIHCSCYVVVGSAVQDARIREAENGNKRRVNLRVPRSTKRGPVNVVPRDCRSTGVPGQGYCMSHLSCGSEVDSANVCRADVNALIYWTEGVPSICRSHQVGPARQI